MGINTAYDGYKAFSYLEKGKDYPEFKFAEWNWAGGIFTPPNFRRRGKGFEISKRKNIYSSS